MEAFPKMHALTGLPVQVADGASSHLRGGSCTPHGRDLLASDPSEAEPTGERFSVDPDERYRTIRGILYSVVKPLDKCLQN